MAPVIPPPRATQPPLTQDAPGNAPAAAKPVPAGVSGAWVQVPEARHEMVVTLPTYDSSFQTANDWILAYDAARVELGTLDEAHAPPSVLDRKAEEIEVLQKAAIKAAKDNLARQQERAAKKDFSSELVAKLIVSEAQLLVRRVERTPLREADVAKYTMWAATAPLENAALALRHATPADPRAVAVAQQEVDRAAAKVRQVARENLEAVNAGYVNAVIHGNKDDIAYCEDAVQYVGSWLNIDHDGERALGTRPLGNLE
jgi:hypothetical protein